MLNNANPPYMGGFPVRCPRCSHIGSARYCSFCGMDLSTCYTVQLPAPPPSYGAFPPPASPQAYPAPSPSPAYPPAAVPPPPKNYSYPPPAPFPAYPLPAAPQPIPPGRMPPPQAAPGQRHTLRNTLLICGISLACILTVIVLYFALRGLGRPGALSDSPLNEYHAPAPSIGSVYNYPQGISSEEFKKIKEGMSYALVCQIIGGEGMLQEQGQTLREEVYYTYLWPGETDPDAWAFITFTGGVVTSISGSGLD